MSIASTWAGVGALMVGMQMARDYGIIPFLLWAFGNTIACILFGIFAPRIPKLREVFRSRIMHYLVGFMCVFQVWTNLNGIQSIFDDTPLTGVFGMALAYAIAIGFIIMLWRNGMIRTVLSDYAAWIGVYAIALLLTVLAMIYSRGNMIPLTMGADQIGIGIEKCVLLLPGPFLYPYFFEMLDYNEQNGDGTKKINITRVFINGGLLFGVYLIFTFLLSWTRFPPALSIVLAVLITLLSTVSSFLYSIYITFGKRLGLAINVATVALWQFIIPLGVMGAWTLMSSIRIWIVFGAIAFALAWHWKEKRSQAKDGR
ncbi:MAG: hypothetical protein PHS57_05840 [Alphaproteobacteria bacterium]|nr:hypothetical protein [Alphaproteobacteria bacterium]